MELIWCAFDSMHFIYLFQIVMQLLETIFISKCVDDRADIRFSITQSVCMFAYLGTFIDHKRCLNVSEMI